MKTLEDLEKIRKETRDSVGIRSGKGRASIAVLMDKSGTVGRQVIVAILKELNIRHIADIAVIQKASGIDDVNLPAIEISASGQPPIRYERMTPEIIGPIIQKLIASVICAREGE